MEKTIETLFTYALCMVYGKHNDPFLYGKHYDPFPVKNRKSFGKVTYDFLIIYCTQNKKKRNLTLQSITNCIRFIGRRYAIQFGHVFHL